MICDLENGTRPQSLSGLIEWLIDWLIDCFKSSNLSGACRPHERGYHNIMQFHRSCLSGICKMPTLRFWHRQKMFPLFHCMLKLFFFMFISMSKCIAIIHSYKNTFTKTGITKQLKQKCVYLIKIFCSRPCKLCVLTFTNSIIVSHTRASVRSRGVRNFVCRTPSYNTHSNGVGPMFLALHGVPGIGQKKTQPCVPGAGLLLLSI